MESLEGPAVGADDARAFDVPGLFRQAASEASAGTHSGEAAHSVLHDGRHPAEGSRLPGDGEQDGARFGQKGGAPRWFLAGAVMRLFETLPERERTYTTKGTFGSESWCEQVNAKWLIEDCETLASTVRLEEGSPRLKEMCRGPAKLLQDGKTLCAIIPPMSISYQQRSDQDGPYSQALTIVYRVARMQTASPHNLMLPATLGA